MEQNFVLKYRILLQHLDTYIIHIKKHFQQSKVRNFSDNENRNSHQKLSWRRNSLNLIQITIIYKCLIFGWKWYHIIFLGVFWCQHLCLWHSKNKKASVLLGSPQHNHVHYFRMYKTKKNTSHHLLFSILVQQDPFCLCRTSWQSPMAFLLSVVIFLR